jgi:hypothetical protein
MDLNCEQCGNPLTAYDSGGRRGGSSPTRFCSRKCKDDFRHAAQRAETQRKRAEQRCRQCGGPISPDAGSRVLSCSRACNVAWQNATRQAAKRAAWLAAKPPCQRCGEPIPESRFRNSKYCSERCKRNEMSARWRVRAPHYNRQYNYGISPEQYEAMMAAQDGRCAICGTSEWMGKDSRPHTDHDHATGVFRGILCGNCNLGVGMFGDDPARLRAAADYLEKAVSVTA